MRSKIQNLKSRIVIVGAGPAGASLAIRLAESGFETVLIERERFPRQKLCGEFISPECLSHFRELGVLDSMLVAGGDRIYETRFFETGGKWITVPSSWFGNGDFALSLSRAEMDNQLLRRAKELGVTVREGAAMSSVTIEDNQIKTVAYRSDDGQISEMHADIFVDATGRAGALARSVERAGAHGPKTLPKPEFVGFKAHISDVAVSPGSCEIYSFPGGYAGLSHVENGLSNLCFLIRSKTVRSLAGDADEIVERVVKRNKRASAALAGYAMSGEWLAVSISGFGTKDPAPASNLFTVGDAASFIDPFTGSGMVMALESAEALAKVMIENRDSPHMIAARYREEYRRRFSNRLRVCSVLRRTAFMPRLATTAVYTLGISSAARRILARATRR
ncbi:MAG TPA: NAD(P)/FAD-dependent oxidoreductase [Pyrinomonadaceae bacterium]